LETHSATSLYVFMQHTIPLQPLLISFICGSVKAVGLGSLIVEGSIHWHASCFFILGDLRLLSQAYIRHTTLGLYLLATWKLNYCNDTPKANFTLVWH